MTLFDTAGERRALAARLARSGVLSSSELRAAVEDVPREAFLRPGVFLPEGEGRWRPVVAARTAPEEWAAIAYSDRSLATQLDGHLTADQVDGWVRGTPTSSSTVPATVVSMIEALGLTEGHTVLEIGTGTGYSTALMCHCLGEDSVTTIEVDPQVATRADDALEAAGYSTWTVTGDGLVGHPRRAPYDRVIATCAVRRIPYTWIRQTRVGGRILATIGSWAYGTGLAEVTVHGDGTARGRIVGRSSFMQARSQATPTHLGDLEARAAYADTERATRVSPGLLEEWMPAFLAQLAAPGSQFVHGADSTGTPVLYLLDSERESFASFREGAGGWVVRQGGPVALWDRVEAALIAWRAAGSPDVDSVQLHITDRTHTYWIGSDGTGGSLVEPPGGAVDPLRWEDRVA
ncbi:ATP-grasp peptide maturase system methyltransferase [Streptomyces buecherae]|uniref:ATP-grasp peptide maturase system methyltransferase n=2 Tax=Streptomyces TaxID=1883 RepID=UPI001C254305|nr:ATP-grasp peptide maturase system methyltransferase [Streptomyces buecherae]